MTRAPSSPPPADEPPDWEAIGRFLSGDSTPAEAEAVATWLAAHPEDAQLVQVVGQVVAVPAVTPTPIDTEAALAKVLARRATTVEVPATVHSLDQARRHRDARVPRQRTSWRTLVAVAAALALMVAGGVLWQSRPDAPEAGVTSVALLATAPGTVDSLRLPDGTSVVLGPGSTLTPSATYGRSDREVELDGEAFFVVSRDDARPFTVRAGAARVVDLGTAFTVRTDRAEGVSVVVTSGRVRLGAAHTADGAVELAAGEAATLRATDTTVRRDSLDVDRAMAFTEGRLVLRDTPVESLAAVLQRWYGLTLTLDPALRGRRLTATFANEARAVVLETLALSLGARAEVRGDSVAFVRIDAP